VKHYLDTSAVLAWILHGSEVLRPLEGEEQVASSRLLWTESSRVIHRGLQMGRLEPAVATEARHNFQRLAAGIAQLELGEAVFMRAEGPYPLPVSTPQALHLASAELWLEGESGASLSVWTLDDQMNHCAAQLGFHTPLLEVASG